MSPTLIPIDTGRKSPYMLEITHHEARIAQLPEALHGATFVHITDLHGGYGNTDPVYEEAIARVNAIKPDLLLLTGDYIDDHAKNNYPIQEVLRRFEARLGVYGSFGNHDHRRGIVGTRRVLELAGVHILHNESVCLESGLWIAGVDDYYEGKPDLARTLANVPDDATPIVLSHNPTLIEHVNGRRMLMLSGHTHGGQIMLNRNIGVGALKFRYLSGLYRKPDGSQLIVSNGIGNWFPLRINAPAEVLQLTLHRA